jgi:hypothetical protein
MRRKREVKRTVKRLARFLQRLEKGFSVTDAARAAGFSRAIAYRWREDDPGFATQWDQASEAGSDLLEDEVRRRAKDGVRRLILHQGKPVLVPTRGYDAEGQPRGRLKPLYERKYSDTLLMFLLSGRRPEKFKRALEPAAPRAPVLAPLPKPDAIEVARRITYLLDEGQRKLELAKANATTNQG